MMAVLQERWRHLAARERMILMIGGAVVIASLLFLLIVDPLLARIDKLERQIGRSIGRSNFMDMDNVGVL